MHLKSYIADRKFFDIGLLTPQVKVLNLDLLKSLWERLPSANSSGYLLINFEHTALKSFFSASGMVS